MLELRSSIVGKKPAFTKLSTLTPRNNDKNGSNKRSITKKVRLTFKIQVTRCRQFQGISIISNVSNDLLFLYCITKGDYLVLNLGTCLHAHTCTHACKIGKISRCLDKKRAYHALYLGVTSRSILRKHHFHYNKSGLPHSRSQS